MEGGGGQVEGGEGRVERVDGHDGLGGGERELKGVDKSELKKESKVGRFQENKYLQF